MVSWLARSTPETPYNKVKQKHITYICKLGAIKGRKSNFILTFLLEGCLVYEVYQFSTSRVKS